MLYYQICEIFKKSFFTEQFWWLLLPVWIGAKRLPTSFFPVTPTNVEISPHNILAFRFNAFSILVSNLNAIPSASPKLLNLNQEYPSEKLIFPVKFLQNWSYNFSCWSYQTLVTWPHLRYNLSHKIKFCWWHNGQKLWRHNFYFKMPSLF